MATDSVKDCPKCTHEYDEDQRCPRMLPCAHSICTFCIQAMIMRNERQCPFCRKNFNATSATKLGKNIAAIDLLNYAKTVEAKAARGAPMSRSEIVRNMKQYSTEMTEENISKYKEAIDQMKAMKENNFELKRNISQKLMQIKHDIMSYIRALEEKCEAKVLFLEKQNEKLDTLMAQMEGKQKELEKTKVVLDEATTLVRVDNAVDEADVSNTAAKTLLQTMKADVSRDQKIHQGIIERMNAIEQKLKCLREILTSPVKLDGDISEQMASIELTEENQKAITPQILQRMSANTRCLVHLEGVYAIQKQGGVTRYGKLSLSDNKLCLHHLSQKQPPTNVSTVEFDDLMKLVDPSSRLTFLQFGNDESRLCTAFMRLPNNTKRTHNFALMCSGEKGVSYVGTYIHYFGENELVQNISCGDYEKNTGDGGKALVPGSGEETGGLLKRTREIGSVEGWTVKGDAQASKFAIITKVKKPYTGNKIFGTVESGIDALVEATSVYPDMKIFRVIDCGIVLIEY